MGNTSKSRGAMMERYTPVICGVCGGFVYKCKMYGHIQGLPRIDLKSPTSGSAFLTPEEKGGKTMSDTRYTVYVPDRTAPYYFPSTHTDEEIRQFLVLNGHPSVENAELSKVGTTITFRRPTGGTKG